MGFLFIVVLFHDADGAKSSASFKAGDVAGRG
jgi:hypothetical protein